MFSSSTDGSKAAAAQASVKFLQDSVSILGAEGLSCYCLATGDF